jgi:hypothetical protein
MYQYLETEQQREQEAGWETQGEAIDWDAEMAEIEAERQEHCLDILRTWLRDDSAYIGLPVTRSTWEAL